MINALEDQFWQEKEAAAIWQPDLDVLSREIELDTVRLDAVELFERELHRRGVENVRIDPIAWLTSSEGDTEAYEESFAMLTELQSRLTDAPDVDDGMSTVEDLTADSQTPLFRLYERTRGPRNKVRALAGLTLDGFDRFTTRIEDETGPFPTRNNWNGEVSEAELSAAQIDWAANLGKNIGVEVGNVAGDAYAMSLMVAMALIEGYEERGGMQGVKERLAEGAETARVVGWGLLELVAGAEFPGNSSSSSQIDYVLTAGLETPRPSTVSRTEWWKRVGSLQGLRDISSEILDQVLEREFPPEQFVKQSIQDY